LKAGFIKKVVRIRHLRNKAGGCTLRPYGLQSILSRSTSMSSDPSGPEKRRARSSPEADRVVWVAGVMIAAGVVLCFAALLNL